MGGIEDRTGQVDQVLLVQELEHLLSSRPQTLARDQMAKRRCTVDFDIPKHGGNARQVPRKTAGF